MSYGNRDTRPSRPVQRREADAARPAMAPGKRTLTQDLPGRGPGSARAPMQRKSDPAAAAERNQRAEQTARWMDTAIRPDLHPPPVQRKGASEAPDQVSPLPASSGGKPMPRAVQAKMGQAFGADLSSVRIHEGPQAASLGALAYTQGTDIHFAPGQYQPQSQKGQELLGHELAHVMQQAQGRVEPTAQAKGVALNADTSLEQEADEQGARAARGERVNGAAGSSAVAPVQASSSPVQRMVDPGAKPETAVFITVGNGSFEKGIIIKEVSGGYLVRHGGGEDVFPYIALNLEDPRRIDAALGPDKWREGVRGKDQDKGRTAYDAEGTQYGRTLPKGQSYSTSMGKAQGIVSENLGTELSPGLIKAIHDQSTEHMSYTPDWRNQQSGNYYDGNIGVGLLPEHFEPEGAEEMAREPSKPMSYHGPRLDDYSGRTEHRISTRSMKTEEVQEALKNILATYKERIAQARSRDEVFDAIAQFSQSLARLHPFEDANTRTNMLLLNKLLVENGFPPSIVEDPKHFYLNTLETWKERILQGMDTWYEHGGEGGQKPTGAAVDREDEVEVRPITDILSAEELEALGPLQVEDPIRAIERQVAELNQLFRLYAELVARASDGTGQVSANADQASASAKDALDRLRQ